MRALQRYGPEGAGYTALMLAACRGHTELVSLLLAKGADPGLAGKVCVGAVRSAADCLNCTTLGQWYAALWSTTTACCRMWLAENSLLGPVSPSPGLRGTNKATNSYVAGAMIFGPAILQAKTCILASVNESRAVVERNLVLPALLTCPPYLDFSDRASRARATAPRYSPEEYSPCRIPFIKAEGILALQDVYDGLAVRQEFRLFRCVALPRTQGSRTPLHVATSAEIVQVLVAAGADVKATDEASKINISDVFLSLL